MWTEDRIWEWYRKQPWIVGFNYLPSYAVNSTEMWQGGSFDDGQIERELSVAAKIGYNSCRVFIQYLLWKEEREQLFEHFERFLEVAYGHGIRTVPILFDDCAFSGKREPYLGKQDEPVKGIHNSGWTPSPGLETADREEEYPLLERYVTEFVTRYGADERVLFWDLYNEPGNSERNEKCQKLLQSAFQWARSCEPAQPMTAGVWKFREFDLECAKLSDLVSYHDYCGLETTVERVERLEEYNRPLLCTEWLHRNANNRWETHLPYYKKKRIGLFNWGLVEGRTQTYLSWNREENLGEGKNLDWQHDVLRKDYTPYRKQEVELLSSLTATDERRLDIPVREMTAECMEFLEKKGLIIRLCPSHHRFEVERGCGIGKDLYQSSEGSGRHKLLYAGINRTAFDAFGMHDENEEILLLGGEGEKELYLLIGLSSWEEFQKKSRRGTLSEEDFICLRCKYNDPYVSFFTMCKGVLHGEAVGEGEGLPATFYVTEPTGIRLDVFPMENYRINPVS